MAEAAERAKRLPDEVSLVAVTKTVPAAAIREAARAGQGTFGENRVQEAEVKIGEIRSELPDLRWHLIGHLQTNKARPAVQLFSLIESVDSVRLARRLDASAAAAGLRVAVLLEVNVAAEGSKSGFLREDLRGALADIFRLTHLEVRGLMTIAPLVDDAEEVRWVFRALRELRDELRERYGAPGMRELSMGMSNDFPVAIEEGATMVRVGRALFGERPRG
ncbi:MAG: YggS family pyridoxal phosphate-dependent enzyme [Chloroflexi bacterium]|nr:YggS family pyridoxal phosphate-dependent enzyme [Chloroflexota bacterium]